MTQPSQSSQKVPKLSFREFQCEWEEKKIWEVFNIFNGFAFASTDSVNEWILWVKIADVGIQEMKKDALSYLPYDFWEKYKKFILNEGDYVVALTRPILSWRLKIAKVDKYFNNSLLNQRVWKIQSQNDLTFIYFLLQKAEIIYAIEKTIGWSDPPNLSPSEINPISVNIPTIPEQQKIASFLSSVDTRIEQLREKKSLLEEYKKWVMQKIFAREIRFKDENGEEYGEWEEKEFDDVFNSIWTKSYQVKSSDILQDWEFPVIDQWQDSIAWYSDNSTRVLKNIPVIVFWDHTTILKYIDFEFIIWADGTKVLKNREWDLKYLFYFLDFNRPNQEWYKRHFSVLRELTVLFPTLPEQQKIAAFLSEIDSKIQSTTEQIEEAEKWKKGLLQAMFI